MKKSVLAVYPGSFDPITLGHEDVIRRAAVLFDTVIVAVAAAHHKKTMFSLPERMDMVSSVFADLPNIKVQSYAGLMRDFAVENGIQVMVRGVRSVTDFDYEMQLAGMNKSLMSDVQTIFMPPSVDYQYVSSTYVREIATLHGEVGRFVAPLVHEKLLARVAENEKRVAQSAS